MSLYKPAMDKIKDLKDGLIYVFGTKEERMNVIAKDPINGKRYMIYNGAWKII